MGARAHLVAGRAVPAALVRAQQRGREGPRGHRPARPGRPGEQPGVRHAQGRARRAARRAAAAAAWSQLGDTRVLADQVAEDRRAAHRRVAVQPPPVGLCASDCAGHHDGREAAGVGLGHRRHRVGQQVADPVLDLAAELVGRAGSRPAPGTARGSAPGQGEEPVPDPLVEVGGLGLQPVRGPGPPARARPRAAGRAGWSGRASARRWPTCSAGPPRRRAGSGPAPW